MDSFAEAKRLVSAEDAARYYGLTFDRTGRKCLCPFHDDHHPSMSFKDGYYRCWACGAAGSAIDLVKGLYGLSDVDALKRLIADFHLPLSVGGNRQSDEERKQAAEEMQKRKWAAAVEATLADWITQTTDRLSEIYRIGHMALKTLNNPDDLDRLTAEQVQAIQTMPQAENTLNDLLSGDINRIKEVLYILKGDENQK